MKTNINSYVNIEGDEITSGEFVRTPWSGNLNKAEMGQPGGLLLAALIQCAIERHLKLNKMAEELGITYGYINQLRNGLRPVNQISDEFSIACAKFLCVPRLKVLMLAGVLTPSDVFEGDQMMASEIAQAMRFICDDMSWGRLITTEMRSSDAFSHFTLIKLYEAATGKVLLNKALDIQSLAGHLETLKTLQDKRDEVVLEHRAKKLHVVRSKTEYKLTN